MRTIQCLLFRDNASCFIRFSWCTSGASYGTMFLCPLTFKHIITVYVTFLLGTCSVPINNGFSLKFNPLSPKEDVKLKSFGGVFAKISQEAPSVVTQEVLPDVNIPVAADYDMGCSNQIAKILPSKAFYEDNGSKSWDKMNFLNVPIVDQPFDNYKILVATAPKHIRISGYEAQPLVIYIIFHDDGDSKSIQMPAIYFVSKENGKEDLKRKEKADPIFIIDSNRTVTGLKSTEVSKFIKFRNKFRDHFKYTVVP